MRLVFGEAGLPIEDGLSIMSHRKGKTQRKSEGGSKDDFSTKNPDRTHSNADSLGKS